ncbi:MAG TPA: hypothetical protein PKH10_06470, partial [bacterium]|nr:hypothetical protein [bacterium]
MKTKTLFFALMALLSFCTCTEKNEAKTDNEVVSDTDSATSDADAVTGDELLSDADTWDFWKNGPRPPDWGPCTGGWEQKEQYNEETGRLEARWCEPPANWRPAAPVDWGTCPEGW